MSSSLYNAIGNPQRAQPGNHLSNFMQQFERFKSSFKGDPREQIQQLLNSGKISQADYNRAVQLANQFQQAMIKR